MKRFFPLILTFLLLSCSTPSPTSVLVLPALHGAHESNPNYSYQDLMQHMRDQRGMGWGQRLTRAIGIKDTQRYRLKATEPACGKEILLCRYFRNGIGHSGKRRHTFVHRLNRVIPIDGRAGGQDKAFDAATCIGCGACVASCVNASAMLFVSAKVSQLALLPQGQVEAKQRVLNMVKQMDEEGFGNCTNTGACAVECPKEISLENIARMNREYLRAMVSAD